MKQNSGYTLPLAPHNILIIWLVFITTYRMLTLLQGHMGLFYDEAYYVHWAQDLSWGYYSKPPMVAWFIFVATSIFGTYEFSVKLLSPLFYAFTAWLIFLISRKTTHHPLVPVLASFIFSTTLLVGFNSLFITTDTPLFFFWTLSLYIFINCLETNKWLSWVLLGFTMGLGMLSKYTFAALPIGFLLFAFFGDQRNLFLNARAWVSVLISIVTFLPNILWNLQFDFIAFNHTKEIAKLDGPLLDPVALVVFLLTQVLIFGIFWSFAIIKKHKTLVDAFKSKRYLLLIIWATLPILVIIGFQALLSRAFANWAGPFLIGASVLAATAAIQFRAKLIAISISLHLALLSIFYHWPVFLEAASIEQTKKNSPYFRLSGWQQLADKITPLHTLPKDQKILSPHRDMLAYIGFYLDIEFPNLVYWNPNKETHIDNHYDLKNNLEQVENINKYSFLVLSKYQNPELLSRFKENEYLGYFEHKLSEKIKRNVHLYRVTTFLGYSKEASANQSSIQINEN